MQKFIDFVESIKEKRIFIQTHNSPDPDAIASAFGLQYILKNLGIDAKICYRGEIEKYNTVKLIETCGIELIPIEKIEKMSFEDKIILVDSQKGNSNITDFPGDEIGVIDHHPVFVKNEYSYSDIRSGVGACSSIIAEYMIKLNIEIPKNIATVLLYGIKMDTLELSRGVSELDIDMFYYLYKRADIDKLNKIQINTLKFDDLAAYSNAIKNIKVYGNMGFADVGFDCPDALLGAVSDFVLALKEIELAVVYSEKTNGIKFSVRNETDYYDAGKIINIVLDGIGNGGGHKSMAGGFVPQSNFILINGNRENYFESKFLEIASNYK